MRKVLGTLVGIAAAILIVAALEHVATMIYQLPSLDSADYETLKHVVGDMPLSAKLLIAAGWLLAPLGGAWLALRICDWRWSGWIVVLVILAGSIANILTLPHPIWMQLCASLLPVLGGWFGIRLHHKPYPGEPLLG
jgi:hypothetical protein